MCRFSHSIWCIVRREELGNKLFTKELNYCEIGVSYEGICSLFHLFLFKFWGEILLIEIFCITILYSVY